MKHQKNPMKSKEKVDFEEICENYHIVGYSKEESEY